MGVREYPNVPRIYLDMDGVIADFERGARDMKMDFKHFKLMAGAYLELLPITGAIEAVKTLEDMQLEVFGLTKIPDANPYAATEKLLWVRRHFPLLEGRVIISPDKGAVGSELDILVDDHPEWANAHNFRGSVIKFEGNWDVTLKTILEIYAENLVKSKG